MLLAKLLLINELTLPSKRFVKGKPELWGVLLGYNLVPS